jgi:parvulin-like peptidyl-prolyl isomerase
MWNGLRLLVVLLLCCVFACAEAGESPVIAEGAWGTITQLDLDQARASSRRGTTDEVLIEQWARNALGAQKALAEKLDQEANAGWRLWAIEQSRGGRELFEKVVSGAVSVTEEETRQAYQDRITGYRTPGSYSFRYIFADTTEITEPTRIAAVRAKIAQAQTELLASLGTNPQRPWMVAESVFNEVAKKYSDVKGDPTRVAGPFKFDEPLQPVIKQMSLSLKKGEVSPVFSTKYGFEILRLEDYIPDTTAEYEKVAGTLRQTLENNKQMEKSKAYIEDLKSNQERYEIYKDRLNHMLPGAHFDVPSTTAVVRAGKNLWAPEKLDEFMNILYRRDWIQARSLEAASDLTWRAFVLPQLLHEDALQAGLINRPTEVARVRFETNTVLANAWVTQHTQLQVAELPAITTEELKARYERNIEQHQEAPKFQMVILTYPINEIRTERKSPAQIEFLYREGEKKLREITPDLIAGASPAEIAQTTTKEARPLTTEIKWVSEGLEFNLDAWETLKKVPPGEWCATPLRTDKGACLVQILDHVPQLTKSLETVINTLKRQITVERSRTIQGELLKQLTDEAKATLKMKTP